MKRYTILHVPLLSFFSGALYRDVCHHWKGTGLAWLLLLLAICWVFTIFTFHRGVSRFVDDEAPKIVSQIPTITIVDGAASIDEPQPYHITDPDTGEVLVVIDTTGTITSLDETEARGLVTRTGLVFEKSAVETRAFSFAEIEEFVLDQDRLAFWLTSLKRLAAPVAYPFALFGSYAVRIIQVLIYAAIGLFFAMLCKSTRTYVQLMRLAVIAVTPCIIVKTILMVSHAQLPMAGLWYFLAAMGYLYFGVMAASRQEDPADEAGFPEVPGSA